MSGSGRHDPDDLRSLSNAELDALVQSLQKRAFAVYENAAQDAEADPQRADAGYARAQQDAAPLIAQATAANDERVRRLRRRARRWRTAAWIIAAIGAVCVAWWWLVHGR